MRNLLIILIGLMILWIMLRFIPVWAVWFDEESIKTPLLIGLGIILLIAAGRIFKIRQATFITTDEGTKESD